MDDVTVLAQQESVWLDRERVAGLYAQMGPQRAEQMVCRAIEELAVRLTHSENLLRVGQTDELLASMRGIIVIADQVGMTGLSLVGGHVANALRQNDGNAVAATMARLLRVGEKSLTAIWDMQDLSI